MSSLPPTRILDAPIFQLLDLMEEADKGSSPTKEDYDNTSITEQTQ